MRAAGKILVIIMLLCVMAPVGAHAEETVYAQADDVVTGSYLTATELAGNTSPGGIPYSYQGIPADPDCDFDNCDGHCPQCNAGVLSLPEGADFNSSPVFAGYYHKQLLSLVLSIPVKPPRS